jgi:hypothetical protein
MQSSAWVALLRHIPDEQHNQLVLVTSPGTEICVQGLLRIDAEFVALKGRLAGSQEGGKLFFVPYVQIVYLGFQNPLKDSEFHEMFGGLHCPEAAEQEPAPPVAPSASVPEAAPGAPPGSGSGVRPAIRSTVLERFRARTSTYQPPSGPEVPTQ